MRAFHSIHDNSPKLLSERSPTGFPGRVNEVSTRWERAQDPRKERRRQPITRCDPRIMLLMHPRTDRLQLKGDRYTTDVGAGFFPSFKSHMWNIKYLINPDHLQQRQMARRGKTTHPGRAVKDPPDVLSLSPAFTRPCCSSTPASRYGCFGSPTDVSRSKPSYCSVSDSSATNVSFESKGPIGW